LFPFRSLEGNGALSIWPQIFSRIFRKSTKQVRAASGFFNLKLNENSKLKTGQKKYFSPFIESNNTDL
jgi:hypothetical protein